MLDHHVSNERYGSINVIVPDAAATAVVVRRLIDELGLPLNRDAAVCLYAALVCDTGRFQYDTTTPAVFELAAELVAFGVPVARSVAHAVRGALVRLPQAPRGGARARGARSRASFVWTRRSPRHDLAHYGVTFEEVEGLIDVVRRTSEAEVAVVLKEGTDGSRA